MRKTCGSTFLTHGVESLLLQITINNAIVYVYY